MENSIQQLFLKYIQNRATQEEISHVLALMQSDAYEREWEAAVLAFQEDSERKNEEAELPDQQLLYQRIKSLTVPKVRIKPLRWIGYAASAILISAIVYFTFPLQNKHAVMAKNEPAKPAAEKQTGHRWIKLPDGSSVQLNSNSRLEYADSFEGQKNREVTLYGEAFFDVAHDAAHPFIIHTGKIKTTVLGTAFNISAYDHEKAVTVTVTRGKVMVQRTGQMLAVLVPNEQLSWKPEVKTVKKYSVDATIASAWKAQDLIMDDITLQQAAILIAKRYHLTVTFKTEKVKKCRFTAAFLNRNEISQVIQVLTDITGASFELKDNHLFIDGPGCEN